VNDEEEEGDLLAFYSPLLEKAFFVAGKAWTKQIHGSTRL
jgi:hypothetical protein